MTTQDELLVRFRGDVVIADDSFAIAGAYGVGGVSWSEELLVLWPGASMETEMGSDSPAGYVVALLQGSRRAGRIGHSFETCVDHAELCAISAAIDMACDEIKRLLSQGSSFFPTVKIFSSTRHELIRIKSLPYPPNIALGVPRQRHLLRAIALQSSWLEHIGGHLELHWVSRGRTIGNKIADGVAGSVREEYKVHAARMASIAERTLALVEEHEAVREPDMSQWLPQPLCLAPSSTSVAQRKRRPDRDNWNGLDRVTRAMDPCAKWPLREHLDVMNGWRLGIGPGSWSLSATTPVPQNCGFHISRHAPSLCHCDSDRPEFLFSGSV